MAIATNDMASAGEMAMPQYEIQAQARWHIGVFIMAISRGPAYMEAGSRILTLDLSMLRAVGDITWRGVMRSEPQEILSIWSNELAS